MSRSRRPSSQTLRVLRALMADPLTWRYGYELGVEVGLRSGSLYPILVRLSDRELLESAWETGAPQGRPPRHLYRLTAGWARVRGHARDHTGESGARATPAAARERPIGGLFILALLVLVAARGVPAAVRALRAASGAGGGDGAAALLARAVRGLSAERAEWGSAMCAELAGVQGARARWSFSLGCAGPALALRMRSSICAPNRGGGGLRSSLLVALAATAGARLLWPRALPGAALRPRHVGRGGILLTLMLGYAWFALTLSRGRRRGRSLRAAMGSRAASSSARRGSWSWRPRRSPRASCSCRSFAALLAPAGVAALAGAGGDARAARCRRSGAG